MSKDNLTLSEALAEIESLKDQLYICNNVIDSLRADKLVLHDEIVRLRGNIAYLVAMIPKPSETPEESGRRIAKETIDEIGNNMK